MTIETRTPIRRRADGSIDTAHYMSRGRISRAEQARSLAGAVSAPTRRSGGFLAALLALLWIGPGNV